MKRLTLTSLFGVLALGLVAAAYPLATADTKAERADCPGQIECPLTGEVICRDQCPATEAAKPANTTAVASDEEAELPPCCRNKK